MDLHLIYDITKSFILVTCASSQLKRNISVLPVFNKIEDLCVGYYTCIPIVKNHVPQLKGQRYHVSGKNEVLR